MTTNDATPREDDRAVPEPDADAVDVFDAADSDSWPPPEMKDAPLIRYVHKVMKYHQPTITPEECWVAIGAVRLWMSQSPDRASEMIQAAVPALQAAAGDDLDAMLDSVHPRAIIRSVWALRGGGWEARISVPEGPDDDGWYDYTGNQSVGTGPTRIAAIQDAVRQVTGAEGSE